MKEETKVKSLLKAIEILECFTEKTPEMGITEISEKLGLYKSNVYNILATYQSKGYIEKNADNDKYRLGIKVLELTRAVTVNMSLRTVILPHMQEIADIAKETVFLGIPNNEGEVLYLDSCSPTGFLSNKSILGVKAPLYCTGVGKAILAFSDSRSQEKVFHQDIAPITSNTITDSKKLRDDLEITRSRGYAIDNMEHEYGIKCVAVPLFDRVGKLVGAISLSGPSLRFTDEKIIEFAHILTQASDSVKHTI